MNIRKRKITRAMLQELVKQDSGEEKTSPKTNTLRNAVRSRLPERCSVYLDHLYNECQKMRLLRAEKQHGEVLEVQKEISRLMKLIKKQIT